MKRISILYIFLIILFACEKDETLLKLSDTGTPARIATPVTELTRVVTQTNLADKLTVEWTKADYDVATEISYSIEVDVKCNGFAKPILVGSTTDTTFFITLKDLSIRLTNDLKIAPFQKTDLQIRVRSTVKDKYSVTSEAVSFSVTPWSDKPLALWIGEHNPTGPVLYATGESTYEGYKYLKAGTFRLTNNPWCDDNVIYGGDGGVLTTGSSASNITVETKGYYKVNVDTENLTYSLTPVGSWGMIGTATPGGWNTSTPLDYDIDKDIWEVQTTKLVNGALKFRADDGWGLNYGTHDVNSLMDSLFFDKDAINIATSGTYKVTIDFSQSQAPYVYKYTVINTGDIIVPAKLWVPGSYQNYDPASAPFLSALSATVFEGYVNIPTATGIKFTDAPDYNHTNYGYDSDGHLSTTGPDIDMSITGFYKINVDVNALTYSVTLIDTWGMVGPSTAGGSDAGWNTSVPMTYNAVKNVWTSTLDLAAGALKFRANNNWDINYGPAVSSDLTGSLVKTDGAITIPEAGNYTVTIDFTKAQSPYEYSYTVKKNN